MKNFLLNPFNEPNISSLHEIMHLGIWVILFTIISIVINKYLGNNIKLFITNMINGIKLKKININKVTKDKIDVDNIINNKNLTINEKIDLAKKRLINIKEDKTILEQKYNDLIKVIKEKEDTINKDIVLLNNLNKNDSELISHYKYKILKNKKHLEKYVPVCSNLKNILDAVEKSGKIITDVVNDLEEELNINQSISKYINIGDKTIENIKDLYNSEGELNDIYDVLSKEESKKILLGANSIKNNLEEITLTNNKNKIDRESRIFLEYKNNSEDLNYKSIQNKIKELDYIKK